MGNWSDPTAWPTGAVPKAGDTVTPPVGTVVDVALRLTVQDPPAPPPVASAKLLPKSLDALLAADPAPLFARLDAALPELLTRGSYQGSQLSWVRDFALGHRAAVKAGDARRADAYARKAVATALGGVRNYQKGGWDARTCLGLGDGTRTRFPLGKAPVPTSVRVFVTDAVWKAVARGADSDADPVDYYQQFLRVDDDQQDADRQLYVRGTDWDRSLCGNNQIRWLPGGRRPAKGATYQVLESQIISPAPASGWTVDGSDVVFATPPAANKAVIAEAVFADYTQTEALDGGYSNVLVDTGYATRFLQEICFLDWCRGHAAVDAAWPEVAAQLVQWGDALPRVGYNYGTVASNYGVGHYSFRAKVAAVLGGTPDGDRLKAEVLDYRTQKVIPTLRGPAPSLKGGHWAEGWSYGDLAARLLIETGKVLDEAGFATPTEERDWAAEVKAHLATACPVPAVAPGAGDYFAYPPPAPAELVKVVGPAAPLNYHAAEGTGLTVARSPGGFYASCLMGNPLWADHQQYAPGHGELWRGADALVITANNLTRNQTIQKTPESNTLVVNDPRGGTVQVYPYSMGVWYGTPGVRELARQVTDAYVFVACDLAPAYSTNANPGGGGPVREWVRSWVALRDLGAVVVCDRVRLWNAASYRAAHWHLSPGAVSVSGATATADRGSSRVQVTGLGDAAVTLVAGELAARDGVTKVPQLKFTMAPDRTDFVLVGVVQTGPAGQSLPVPAWVPDGAQVGAVRVTFPSVGVVVG